MQQLIDLLKELKIGHILHIDDDFNDGPPEVTEYPHNDVGEIIASIRSLLEHEQIPKSIDDKLCPYRETYAEQGEAELMILWSSIEEDIQQFETQNKKNSNFKKYDNLRKLGLDYKPIKPTDWKLDKML
jgi:hypothetical protein